MEVYSCKTLIMNLAWEHKVVINTFTTDRSSSIKSLLRFGVEQFETNTNYNFSELSAELPPGHPLIAHMYDIWHFIKVMQWNAKYRWSLSLFSFQSILKDLFKACKLKSCSGNFLPHLNYNAIINIQRVVSVDHLNYQYALAQFFIKHRYWIFFIYFVC